MTAAPMNPQLMQLIQYLSSQGQGGLLGQGAPSQVVPPQQGGLMAGAQPTQLAGAGMPQPHISLTPEMIQQIMQQRAMQAQAMQSQPGPGQGLADLQQAQRSIGIGGR